MLRPLLLDNVPSIQQSAALALGRLANYSDELAEAVVSNEILPQLVYSLSEQNVSYKNNLNFEKWAFCLIIELIFKRFSKFIKFIKQTILKIIFNSLEILQESRRLRTQISRQALPSSR